MPLPMDVPPPRLETRTRVAIYRATQAVIEAAHDRGMALSQEAARDIAIAAIAYYMAAFSERKG